MSSIKLQYHNSHYILLRHYYSMNFPWWFDRKKFGELLHSPILKATERIREIRVTRRLLQWFDRILLARFFLVQAVEKKSSKSSNQSAGQNAWIDPCQKTFYFISLISILNVFFAGLVVRTIILVIKFCIKRI